MMTPPNDVLQPTAAPHSVPEVTGVCERTVRSTVALGRLWLSLVVRPSLMRTLIILLAVLLLGVGSVVAREPFPPVGDHKADLLVLGMPKTADDIARRLTATLAADPAWLKSYLAEKALKPGEPLPYHERFGITKEEYQILLKAMDKMEMIKVGEVMAKVQATGGKIVIKIEGTSMPTDTFEFTDDGKSMKCSFGTTAIRTEIDQTEPTSPTGPWKGTQWTLEQGTPDLTGTKDAITIKVALGTDAAGRRMIYIRMVGRHKGAGVDIGNVIRWTP